MTDPENNFSRLNRKKGRKRADRILNILIVAVVVGIIITATIIFKGGSSQVEPKEPSPTEEAKGDALQDEDNNDDATTDQEDGNAGVDDTEDAADESDLVIDETDESGVVTYLYTDDDIIAESIIDPSWKPIGTTQTGEHVSLYDKNSVDWKEKQEAIADATGLAIDDTITWKIKNGGDSQKSIGIVSSKDKAEKYRVYLEWVEDEGWQTMKMDVLKTLDFDY